MGILSKLFGSQVPVVGASSSVFSRSLFCKSNSGSEINHYCRKCGRTTLHRYISEDELKCSECGKVIDD